MQLRGGIIFWSKLASLPWEFTVKMSSIIDQSDSIKANMEPFTSCENIIILLQDTDNTVQVLHPLSMYKCALTKGAT